MKNIAERPSLNYFVFSCTLVCVSLIVYVFAGYDVEFSLINFSLLLLLGVGILWGILGLMFFYSKNFRHLDVPRLRDKLCLLMSFIAALFVILYSFIGITEIIASKGMFTEDLETTPLSFLYQYLPLFALLVFCTFRYWSRYKVPSNHLAVYKDQVLKAGDSFTCTPFSRSKPKIVPLTYVIDVEGLSVSFEDINAKINFLANATIMIEYSNIDALEKLNPRTFHENIQRSLELVFVELTPRFRLYEVLKDALKLNDKLQVNGNLLQIKISNFSVSPR